MEEQIFKQDAKTIVDMFFDTKLFKENVTRDDMNAVEELIKFLLQSKFESYQRAQEFYSKIQKQK